MIGGVHHNAYRCRDSEETRHFYEGFLGLPLAAAQDANASYGDGKADALHTFYQLGNGSYLAFFEAPAMPFDFKAQHVFDLHIALEVSMAVLHEMFEKGKSLGIETRGIADHGCVHSIYFRDPNGYLIELTAKTPEHDRELDPACNGARERLERWQAEKPHSLRS